MVRTGDHRLERLHRFESRSLFEDDRGAVATEYAILASLIAAFVASAVWLVGQGLLAFFSSPQLRTALGG